MMRDELSNTRIGGVALLLFSAVLLGVGIHHLVATGTCSSTGYSANYGPVPTCPSGTGWWFAFVFGGIIGCLIGAVMAAGIGLVFAGIFGAIGFGSLSIAFDSGVKSSTKLFGAIFGGCFALVGVVAGVLVIGSAVGSLRGGIGRRRAPQGSRSSGAGAPEAASAFGPPPDSNDPIFSAYHASASAAGNASISASASRATAPTATPAPTPLNLVTGLQAAKRAMAGDAADELAKLAALHDKGALTDSEFATAKAKLLGRL